MRAEGQHLRWVALLRRKVVRQQSCARQKKSLSTNEVIAHHG
jgi:hypothetical protein